MTKVRQRKPIPIDTRPEIQAAIETYIGRIATEYPYQVFSITLYGSQARGRADRESDIDLFIVIRQDTPALREALADLAWQIQFDCDVVISDTIRSLDQLSRMQLNRFPFYQSIEREGILLWKNTSAPMHVFA